MSYPRCNNCGDFLKLPNEDETRDCPSGCVDNIYGQRCHKCGEVLRLPEVNGIKPCVNGCRTKIRGSVAMYDCPQFPATILLDDISEVVIENFQGLYLYNYALSPYPPSHHMR